MWLSRGEEWRDRRLGRTGVLLWANRKDNRASQVAHKVTGLPTMWEARVQSLDQEDPLEKGMAAHSSILAWRIPWTEKPGGIPSMGSQRVGPDWAANAFTSLSGRSISEMKKTEKEQIWGLRNKEFTYVILKLKWQLESGGLHLETTSV